MNSENDAKDTKVFEDMTKLINFSYAAKKDVLTKKNTAVKTVSVPYKVIPFIGPERTVNIPLESKEDVTAYTNDVKPEIIVKTDGINPWKLSKDTSVGTLEFKQRDAKKSYKLYPMISKSTLIKDNIIIYSIVAILLVVVLALIVLLISSIRRRKNRGGRRMSFKRR